MQVIRLVFASNVYQWDGNRDGLRGRFKHKSLAGDGLVDASGTGCSCCINQSQAVSLPKAHCCPVVVLTHYFREYIYVWVAA